MGKDRLPHDPYPDRGACQWTEEGDVLGEVQLVSEPFGFAGLGGNGCWDGGGSARGGAVRAAGR
jgi:hypothetical protein